MRYFLLVLLILISVGLRAQNFDEIFAPKKDSTSVIDPLTGVNWCFDSGVDADLTVGTKTFRLDIADWTSGRDGFILVLGKQSFLYFHESCMDDDGNITPLGTYKGYPVFMSHKEKYYYLKIGKEGNPYPIWQ